MISYYLFIFQVQIPEVVGEERLKYFPRTLFHENATTFDLISENYPFVNPDMSRLALEVVLVHGKNVNNGSNSMLQTNDDEYTPSVFSSYSYLTSGRNLSVNKTRVGYLQWKPISYQDGTRKSTSSQHLGVVSADMPEDVDCRVEEIPASLASYLYGSDPGAVGNVTHWFVVFGTSGDDTHLSPGYNTWLVTLHVPVCAACLSVCQLAGTQSRC